MANALTRKMGDFKNRIFPKYKIKAVRCVAGAGDIVLERRHKSDGGGMAVSDADGQWQNAEVTGSCTPGTPEYSDVRYRDHRKLGVWAGHVWYQSPNFGLWSEDQ